MRQTKHMSGPDVAHDCQFATSHVHAAPVPKELTVMGLQSRLSLASASSVKAITGLKVLHCLVPQVNPIYVTDSPNKLSILMKPISHIPMNITIFISISVPLLKLFCSPIMASLLPSIHEVQSHPTSPYHVLGLLCWMYPLLSEPQFSK